MTEFHFIRPMALLLLLLLLPLLLLLKRQNQRNSYWSGLIPAHLQQAMLHQQDATKPAKVVWPIATLVLMTIALAGPSWEKQAVPLFQVQQGRVLLLDMSASMWATDLKPNRLTHARYKAQDLLALINEGELGLVAFAGDAFTLAPLTNDRSTIANLIPVLAPELMPVLGSNLPAGLAAADQLLRDAGYQQGEIILISDDIVPEHLSAALKLAEKQPWQIKVLAIGSAAGAPMTKPDGELIRTLDGSVALAKTNYDALQQLASVSAGKLVPYRADNADLKALLSGIDLDEEATENDQQSHQLWLDRGGYLIALLLPLLAFTLRRHSLLALLPLLLITVPPAAEAGPWQTDDQQGQTLFQQQQFSDAATTFSDPAWRGSAHYRAGEYQQALEAFSQAEGVDALYNQGNALAQLGQTEQALERYQQVLEQQPDHAAAKANKSLLEQMQQQQNSQSGDESDSDQDSEQESDQQSEQSSQQQGDQGQNDEADSDQSDESSEQSSDQASQQDSDPSQQQSQQEQQQSGQPQDNQSQAEPQPEPSESADKNQQSDPQQHAGAQAESEPAEQDPSANSEAMPAAGVNPNEELTEEQQRQLQQLLQQVQDDPSLLLRNKMEREYLRRRQQGELNREQTQW